MCPVKNHLGLSKVGQYRYVYKFLLTFNRKSLDLVESLLRLSEVGQYEQVKQLFSFPIKHCPDMLVLALLQISTSWHTLRHELISTLMPIFLGNHPNSAIILHYAWHGQVSVAFLFIFWNFSRFVVHHNTLVLTKTYFSLPPFNRASLLPFVSLLCILWQSGTWEESSMTRLNCLASWMWPRTWRFVHFSSNCLSFLKSRWILMVKNNFTSIKWSQSNTKNTCKGTKNE